MTEQRRIARLICQDENGKCLHDESTCEKHDECYALNKAKRLIDTGFGNVTQALTEFAEYLKDYVGQVQDVGYEGIGKIDIDEKLKEFLNNDR